jgi:hypothetical protein
MRQVVGAILMAIGILIGGGSGLCALIFLGLGVMDGSHPSEVFAYALAVCMPLLLGAGLVFAGRYVQRSDPDRQDRH